MGSHDSAVALALLLSLLGCASEPGQSAADIGNRLAAREGYEVSFADARRATVRLGAGETRVDPTARVRNGGSGLLVQIGEQQFALVTVTHVATGLDAESRLYFSVDREDDPGHRLKDWTTDETLDWYFHWGERFCRDVNLQNSVDSQHDVAVLVLTTKRKSDTKLLASQSIPFSVLARNHLERLTADQQIRILGYPGKEERGAMTSRGLDSREGTRINVPDSQYRAVWKRERDGTERRFNAWLFKTRVSTSPARGMSGGPVFGRTSEDGWVCIGLHSGKETETIAQSAEMIVSYEVPVQYVRDSIDSALEDVPKSLEPVDCEP